MTLFLGSGRHVRLDGTRQFVALFIVVQSNAVEPLEEASVCFHSVRLRSRLEQSDLRENLKLFSFLVEVDEAIFGRVANCRVEHDEVGEESTEVRDRSLRDGRLHTNE